MNLYLTLKWLHIISSMLLVGTGFGSAFYLYFIHHTNNQQAITQVIKLVIRADNWFTLPTILIQPVTGFFMIYIAQYSLKQTWIFSAIGLYLLAGTCYLPVYILQKRMLNIANQSLADHTDLPAIYWRYAKYWEWLGYPAFIAMMLIFGLMVFKPI